MTMATRKRHTPEQVVRKLAQAHRLLGEGNCVADLCRELGVSEQIKPDGPRLGARSFGGSPARCPATEPTTPSA
jgi:hypothetical protein